MTWAAKFGTAEKRDGRTAFTLLFTDGAGAKIQREYVAEFVDDEFVRRVATEEIARIESSDAAPAKLSLAKGDAVAVIGPTPPTQADLDRIAFKTAWARYQSRMRGVAAGLMASDDKLVTDAKAVALSLFTSAFADEL